MVDVSMYSARELILVIENDEYLYNLMNFDRRQCLEVIESYFKFTEDQWNTLIEEY